MNDRKYPGFVVRIPITIETGAPLSAEDAELALKGSDGETTRFPSSSNDVIEQMDPAAKVKKATEKMLANIAYATRRYDALNRVEKAVAAYGGWGKFESDLTKDIIESLKEEAKAELAKMEAMGGAVEALDPSYLKAALVRSNTARLKKIELG